MRVAITNPFAWPHVRRGSERLLNDLAVHLHAEGMQVDVHAMGPADVDEIRDGVRYRLVRERCRSTWRQFNSLHYFAWRLQSRLAEDPPDVVFCLNYFDAYAAIRARKRHGLRYRVVFQSVGIPIRRYFRTVPLDRWFIRTVLRNADACLVLSRFAQRTLRNDFDVSGQVFPPPVATGPFDRAGAVSGSTDTVLFVGDVDEPRKGAAVLCDAYARLRDEWPGLRLCFAGRASDERQQALRARPSVSGLGDAVGFVGVGQVEDLPALFGAALVTVLPAVWEAFGLVLIESLAAGTPVVGADHGGIGDIVDGPLVGALFDPAPFRRESEAVDALEQALRLVLRRGKSPAVVAACRERAQAFSWTVLGPKYASLVRSLAPPEHAVSP